jgi:large subunit ribosomal protein L29
MNAEKIRNLTSEELSHQEKDMSDQLFKLKFQLNMGQTESLTKIRGLRKDIARVKTIVRERAGATATSAATSAATSTVKSTAKLKSEKK